MFAGILVGLRAFAALPQVLGYAKELFFFMQDALGPDYAKRLEEIRSARELWSKVNIPGATEKEKDDALITWARAINSKS